MPAPKRRTPVENHLSRFSAAMPPTLYWRFRVSSSAVAPGAGDALCRKPHAVVVRIEVLARWRHPASEARDNVEAVRASGGAVIGALRQLLSGYPDAAISTIAMPAPGSWLQGAQPPKP